MSKMVVAYETNINSEKLKYILPTLAYYFTTGPWRIMWVRFGYDPRKDFESRYYQQLDYRITLNSGIKGHVRDTIFNHRSRLKCNHNCFRSIWNVFIPFTNQTNNVKNCWRPVLARPKKRKSFTIRTLRKDVCHRLGNASIRYVFVRVLSFFYCTTNTFFFMVFLINLCFCRTFLEIYYLAFVVSISNCSCQIYTNVPSHLFIVQLLYANDRIHVDKF